MYFKQLENNNIDDEYIPEPVDTNDIDDIYNDINEKMIRYKKKCGLRDYYPKDNTNNININYILEEINPDDQIEQLSKIQNKKNQKKYLKNLNNKEHTGDTSSDESYLSGMTFILNNKEIKEPRNNISNHFLLIKKMKKLNSQIEIMIIKIIMAYIK